MRTVMRTMTTRRTVPLGDETALAAVASSPAFGAVATLTEAAVTPVTLVTPVAVATSTTATWPPRGLPWRRTLRRLILRRLTSCKIA